MPATHTLNNAPVSRADRPSAQVMRRWHAANRLLRMSDVARVTQQAGLTLDTHQTAQLIRAGDEYDAATRVERAMTAPTIQQRLAVDTTAVASRVLDLDDAALLIAASILDA